MVSHFRIPPSSKRGMEASATHLHHSPIQLYVCTWQHKVNTPNVFKDGSTLPQPQNNSYKVIFLADHSASIFSISFNISPYITIGTRHNEVPGEPRGIFKILVRFLSHLDFSIRLYPNVRPLSTVKDIWRR